MRQCFNAVTMYRSKNHYQSIYWVNIMGINMRKSLLRIVSAILMIMLVTVNVATVKAYADEVTNVVMTYEEKVFTKQLYSVDVNRIKDGVETDGLKGIGELCDNLALQTNGAAVVDREAVKAAVKSAVMAGQKSINIDLTQYTPAAIAQRTQMAVPVAPALNEAVANTANAATVASNVNDILVNNALNSMGINCKISEASTKFNPNQDRAVNVRNAASKINGWILQPGMGMSANFAFTPRTTANGYGLGNVLANGGHVKAMGGGICQVSSTLNLAILRAGIIPTVRHNHSERSTYIASGLDATISGNTLDYQFVNTLAYPIYISAQTNGGVLTVSIYSNANALMGIVYEPKVIGGSMSNKTYLIGTLNGVEVSNRYCYSSRYKK